MQVERPRGLDQYVGARDACGTSSSSRVEDCIVCRRPIELVRLQRDNRARGVCSFGVLEVGPREV